jgi:hypothetical protein
MNLRRVFSGPTPAAGAPWTRLLRRPSALALGERRPPLGRRLSDPGLQLPAHSRIVLRPGGLNLR